MIGDYEHSSNTNTKGHNFIFIYIKYKYLQCVANVPAYKSLEYSIHFKSVYL